jgi:NCS1 family nucleobase:cation symporter-1
VCTWAGPSFDINQWNTGSSFITIGLTVSQATAREFYVHPVTSRLPIHTIAVMLGSLIATLGIVFMGLPGAKYHVGFPSLVRPTFGTSASKIIVGLRGLVGVVSDYCLNVKV